MRIMTKIYSGDFFYRKSTIGTTIAAIDAHNETYCLQKRIEKFPLNLNSHTYVFDICFDCLFFITLSGFALK